MEAETESLQSRLYKKGLEKQIIWKQELNHYVEDHTNHKPQILNVSKNLILYIEDYTEARTEGRSNDSRLCKNKPQTNI